MINRVVKRRIIVFELNRGSKEGVNLIKEERVSRGVIRGGRRRRSIRRNTRNRRMNRGITNTRQEIRIREQMDKGRQEKFANDRGIIKGSKRKTLNHRVRI